MVNLGTLAVARDGAISVVRPMMDRALSAVRLVVDRAVGRFSAGIWPVVQSAVAAGLAWYAAMLVLGHDRPFVAAIAAVISVGAVAGQTMRRAAEWMLGVAVGLAVAGLVVVAIGTGPVQTGVMVGLAMGVALLIRGGIMFWTEVGVSAILVSGLDPTTRGVSPDRFVEALVGCGVALAVSAAFPSNPSLRVRKAARPVLGDLATVYRDVAAAFIGGDLELSQRALAEARQIDARVSQLLEELDGGYQIARYAPPRMRQLGPMGHYATTADHLDLAVRDTRVLARAAVTLVSEKRAAPGPLAEALLELALAVEALAGYLDKPDQLLDARVFALGAAKEATSALETSNDVETSALVGQIRATALDLLQATGMDPSEALEALRETSRR
jgi:uncharacterized membrane protein YccC